MQNKNKRWLIITSLIILTGILAGRLFLSHKNNLPVEQQNPPTELLAEQQTSSEPIVIKLPSPENKDLAPQNETVLILPNQELTPPILPDQPYHLFFDLRHILLHSSGTTAAKAVGVSNMFWYTVKHKHTPNHLEIQARLFEFMDYCTKQPRGAALFNNEPMPAIMCQWICGALTTQQFLDTLLSYQTEIKEFFVSQEEKNLVLGTLELLKPDVICKIQRPITKMVTFFQECCKQFPDQIYILSNWDRESVNLIRREFSQIFDSLPAHHSIFSGETGKIKPHADSFNEITQRMNLDPKKCVLIDDSPENVRAAKALGWRTILHKNTDRTIHKIKKLLAIKANISKTKKKKKNKHGA